jgi:hypothetical protein
VRGRLGIALRQYLDAYLPDDVHELCDGNTFLAVTRGARMSGQAGCGVVNAHAPGRP